MRAWPLVLALAGTACSSARYGASDTGAPSVTLPARFAEGHNEHADAGAAAPPVPSAEPVGKTDLPDPDPPLRTASQWEYSLHYAKGDVSVTAVRAMQLDKPMSTPRRVGRFAVELWIGKELVERVRFEFPLLAADLPPPGKKRPLHDPPRFSPGADTVTRVLVPASDRATAAVLVDRLTGKRTPLPWPPSETSGVAPAGAPDAGPGRGSP